MLRPPIVGGKAKSTPPPKAPSSGTSAYAAPYVCTVCGKRFAMPISLALHGDREHAQKGGGHVE